MTMFRSFLMVGVLWVHLAPQASWAQVPAKTQATTAVDAAEQALRSSAEAMERARRQAQGPLLRIKRASQLDRRSGPAIATEPPPPPPPGADTALSAEPVTRRSITPDDPADSGIRETVERLPAEPASRQETEGSAPSATAQPPVAEPPPEPSAAPAAAAPTLVAEPPSPAAPTSLPAAEAQGGPLPRDGASGASAASLPLPPGLPLMSPPGLQPPVAEPAQVVAEPVPRLVNLEQPAMPTPLLAQLARLPGLTVELRLNRDGSVADVQFLETVPRAAERALRTALTRWRFEPLPRDVMHRVELVFDR